LADLASFGICVCSSPDGLLLIGWSHPSCNLMIEWVWKPDGERKWQAPLIPAGRTTA
jgi:hypothetical protein